MKDLHGTPTGYRYGCRCPRCRQAQTDRMRLYRQGKKPKVSARQKFLAELVQQKEQAQQIDEAGE